MRWTYWAWVVTLPTQLMMAAIVSSAADYLRTQWKTVARNHSRPSIGRRRLGIVALESTE